MSYFKIIGFTVTALSAIVLFKRMKEEYALFISLLAGMVLTSAAITLLQPVMTYIDSFAGMEPVKGFIPLLLKSAGIAVITTVAADLCRDAGEQALGNRLEMCGKALIVSLALPLIKNVFDSCLTLLE